MISRSNSFKYSRLFFFENKFSTRSFDIRDPRFKFDFGRLPDKCNFRTIVAISKLNTVNVNSCQCNLSSEILFIYRSFFFLFSFFVFSLKLLSKILIIFEVYDGKKKRKSERGFLLAFINTYSTIDKFSRSNIEIYTRIHC